MLRAVLVGMLAEMERCNEPESRHRSGGPLGSSSGDDCHEKPPEPVMDGWSTSGPGGSFRASQTV
jgi:hypothetical protein